MKKEISEERALFCQALIEGLARKYEEELAQCPELIPCSEEHLRKMNDIVEGHAKSVKQVKVKRRITALLLAAALLLLTACTVYAYRGEIKKIFAKIRDTYIWLSYDDSEDAMDALISEHYTLGYVPDGYEFIDEASLKSVERTRWENLDGDYLILEQSVWDGTRYSVDSEIGEATTLVCGESEVYYRVTHIHMYVWNDGTYSFIFMSSAPLSYDILELILAGIVIKQ